MNYIWGAMILLPLVIGAMNGQLDATVHAGLGAAKDSVQTVLSFAGIMCLWSGIMKIADEGGVSAFIGRLLSPVTKLLFPKLKQGGRAMRAITMNMTANLLGLGNAATPLGLSAMHELDEINEGRKHASDEMCTFVVLNTASFQLIPTTLISLRVAAESQNPFEIMLPIWIASACSVSAAVFFVKLFCRRKS